MQILFANATNPEKTRSGSVQAVEVDGWVCPETGEYAFRSGEKAKKGMLEICRILADNGEEGLAEDIRDHLEG